jgi:hypothetical protein
VVHFRTAKLFVVLAALALVGHAAIVDLALAQDKTPPAGGEKSAQLSPNPAPSPSPSPTPEPDFHSPFNGDKKAGPGGEQADFKALLDLYDTKKDAPFSRHRQNRTSWRTRALPQPPNTMPN